MGEGGPHLRRRLTGRAEFEAVVAHRRNRVTRFDGDCREALVLDV